MHQETARSEIRLSEAIREGLPARGRKKPGDPVEPIPASDLRPDMVETRDLPVNPLYPPKVVVRVDGTVGISPPHRGNYIGPPWCSIEVHSATLRQVCPKPLIAREPATAGGAGAEPPLDPLIEVLREMYPPHGDVPDVPARVLDQNLCMSLGSSFHAARFALSYHVLTARSAARMDLAIGMSASTGWGEIIANPVRSERL